MRTNIEGFKPQHGVEFVLDTDDAKTADALLRIRNIRSNAEELFAALAMLMIMDRTGGVIKVPCRRCFLDVALMYEEAAVLMRELAGEKCKP